MKTLNREDIEKVRPRFRPMVLKAWENGEEVPESLTLISDSPLTIWEIQRGIELAKQWEKDHPCSKNTP